MWQHDRMQHDYESLLWLESADIADFLNDLPDESFDVDSLCEGWRVRDAVSHMIVGHTTAGPRMFVSIAKFGFNVPKASKEASREYGSAHSPDELRTEWQQVTDEHIARGIARLIPDKEGFTDHLIHHQDMRRPLHLDRQIPPERLLAALDALPSIGGFLKSKQRMKGLRWVATDVDWSWGTGPEVSGTAEALMLTAAGRPIDIEALSGAGVATVEGRL